MHFFTLDEPTQVECSVCNENNVINKREVDRNNRIFSTIYDRRRADCVISYITYNNTYTYGVRGKPGFSYVNQIDGIF